MDPKCVAAVNAAAGRKLTAGELRQIEERLDGAARQLARTEPGWSGLTRDQRVLKAGERATAEVIELADRRVRNAELQVLKTAAMEGRVERFMRQQLQTDPLFGKTRRASRSKALADELNETRTWVEAEHAETMKQLVHLMEAVSDGTVASAGRRVAMFLWDADNPAMTRDLVIEIFRRADGHTGNKIAREGAQAWLQVIEARRQRFNAAGGDVGRLSMGYLPQPHDAGAIRSAGADLYVSKNLPRVDRTRYVHPDGRMLNDAELAGVLREVWDTIQSEGLNQRTPGQFSAPRARADRGSEHRMLHFRDADAYLEYMAEFGRGNVYDAMRAHLSGTSRDIVLLERYGPNPDAQMRLQFDLARQQDGTLEKQGVGIGAFRVDAEGMWKVLSGAASSPASEFWASTMQAVRNYQTAVKLGATVVKSLPDVITYFTTTGFNRLPYLDALANLKRVAMDAEAREFLGMHGLMASSGIETLNRFTSDTLGRNWSGRLAASTMKLQLATAWTDWLSRAFGMTKMHGLGRMAALPWERLTDWDRALLERRGIDAEAWQVVNLAKPDDFKGMPFLTPESIVATGHERAREVATAVLAMIRDETQYAVVQPDLFAQTARTWNGLQAGTGTGELARSTMLFKSFPFAMITRHWRRAFDVPTVHDGSAPIMGNRLVYIGALTVGGTAMGAIVVQAMQILTGRDPIDMTGEHAAKFWAQAFTTGGGLGFYGDLFSRDTTQDRSAFDAVGRALGGPVLGDAADLYMLVKGNADEALAGKDTHAGAEALKFGARHIPYINLWYTKAALDHAVMHNLQENLSPGYLDKMRQRAAKDWGQSFWWVPGQDVPQRAPDLGRAVGEPSQ